MRAGSLLLPVVAVSLLTTGCSSAPEPPPTPTETPTAVAEPTTLKELETAVQDEGLVDTAIIAQTPGVPDGVSVQLLWRDLPSPDDQLAALAEVDAGLDDSLGGLEITQMLLGPLDQDDRRSGVSATYDPGRDMLRALLETTYDSPCSMAELNRQDTEEGVRAQVDMRCYIDTTDIAGLAASYDEVTAIGFDVDGIDDTRWELSVERWSTSDALFRLETGPIEGHQDLLVDLATMAEDAGADQIQVVDGETGFSIHGTADADQSGLCTTMHDRITAAGVEHSSVYMQLPEPDGDEDWACSL